MKVVSLESVGTWGGGHVVVAGPVGRWKHERRRSLETASRIIRQVHKVVLRAVRALALA